MMGSFFKKIFFITDLLKNGEYLFVWNGIKKRIKSKNLAIGLKRDLSFEWEPPRSLIDLSIRRYQSDDSDYFILDNSNHGLIEKNINSCYVATNKDGAPCFRQWLMDSSENPKINAFWGNSYPELKNDEALLESAYTIPKYRGFGIMPAATNLISEKGKEQGIKHIITFVPKNNINALRAIVYAGYQPYILRTENWFLFRKQVSFDEISSELLEFFNKSTLRKI